MKASVNAGAQMHLLFVYGTLRDHDIQRAVFGRTFGAEPDSVIGHRLGTIEIDGQAFFLLQPSEDAGDEVPGLVLPLTEAELALADAYEGQVHYARVTVSLRSGRDAFVYVAAVG